MEGFLSVSLAAAVLGKGCLRNQGCFCKLDRNNSEPSSPGLKSAKIFADCRLL